MHLVVHAFKVFVLVGTKEQMTIILCFYSNRIVQRLSIFYKIHGSHISLQRTCYWYVLLLAHTARRRRRVENCGMSQLEYTYLFIDRCFQQENSTVFQFIFLKSTSSKFLKGSVEVQSIFQLFLLVSIPEYLVTRYENSILASSTIS